MYVWVLPISAGQSEESIVDVLYVSKHELPESPGFEQSAWLIPFYVEAASSPHACLGFL